MNKTITLTNSGKKYTLEFNRATVVLMERQGFNITSFESKSALNTSLLLKYAFHMHHRKLSEDEIFEIYKDTANRDSLIGKLLDMVTDTYSSILGDEEDEETQGNAVWEASW